MLACDFFNELTASRTAAFWATPWRTTKTVPSTLLGHFVTTQQFGRVRWLRATRHHK